MVTTDNNYEQLFFSESILSKKSHLKIKNNSFCINEIKKDK